MMNKKSLSKLERFDILKLIEKIQSAQIHNKNGYIKNIQFPSFKKIKENSYISFDFPLTALVGKNGSSKTSVLHALYGAPWGFSCSKFWFSTHVDPIDEVGGLKTNRQRFNYEYIDNKNIAKVYKSRIRKENDPDYWETTRPPKTDRTHRYAPVKKDVLFIDFRAELSAFDIASRFPIFRNDLEIKRNLLTRSKYLKNLFETGDAKMPKLGRKAGKVETINENALNIINWILGKTYSEVKVASHKIYTFSGVSVLLKSAIGGGQYSEANAGSGEIAVIQLVRKLESAKPNTLVLLDEPETSLHPAAQKRLLKYLLYCILDKNFQIVMATHSQSLISDLPSNARKKFMKEPNSDCFSINNVTTENDAFYEINEFVDKKIKIVCEDNIAKFILEKILFVEEKERFVDVIVCPGGAESILQLYLPMMVQNKDLDNTYLILDGDKNYSTGNISNPDLSSSGNLENEVYRLFKQKFRLNLDGKDGLANESQKIDFYSKFIKFHGSRVLYLPQRRPEDILRCLFSENEQSDHTDSKELIASRAEAEYGICDAKKIDDTAERLALQFAKRKFDLNRQKIWEELQKILSSCNC